MNLKSNFNFPQDSRELKVMAIVENWAIVANLKGQFVGIIEKISLPNAESFRGRVSDTKQEIAVVVPASYKHERTVCPIVFNDIEQFWWGLDKTRNELVIIRHLSAVRDTFVPRTSSIAANVMEYTEIPLIELQ